MTKMLKLLPLLLLVLQCSAVEEWSAGNHNGNDAKKIEDQAAVASSGLRQQSSVIADYGTEVSWPMQGHSTAKMSEEQRSAYREYLLGCIKAYDQNRCQQNEEERISINAAQPAYQHNFTTAGYAKLQLPDDVFQKLQSFWENNQDLMIPENWDYANIYTNHWESETKVLLIDDIDRPMPPSDRRMIVEQVQNILEKWTGAPLVPTSMYGIRVYQEGSILAPHVDRVPLVTSAIINVAQDLEEDWVLEVISHDGRAVNVTMAPGDIVLYESHSIIHGRPYGLKGRYYANLFLHFEPVGYSAELERRMAADNAESQRPDKLSLSEMFHRALKKFNVIPVDEEKAKSATKKPTQRRVSRKLPAYIKEGTREAARWRQEYVFYRNDGTESFVVDEISSKHKKIPQTSNAKRTPGVTNAHLIAADGDVRRLKDIAAKNPESLNEADSNGWKPIHEAARSGNTEAVEFLLQPEFGIDINERTNNGKGATPLWWAEHELPRGHPVIHLLRQHGGIAMGPNA